MRIVASVILTALCLTACGCGSDDPATGDDANAPAGPASTDQSSAIEPNNSVSQIAKSSEPAEPAVPEEITEGPFAGFLEMVEALSAGDCNAVYGYMSEALRANWGRQKFISQTSAFREEIGSRWRIRPERMSAGLDELGAYCFVALALTDANDFQLFAELAAEEDAFTVSKFAMVRMKINDESLSNRISKGAEDFVTHLVNGRYDEAMDHVLPRGVVVMNAATLGDMTEAVWGQIESGEMRYSAPDWIIENGRNVYAVEAHPAANPDAHMRMFLWDAIDPDIAIDYCLVNAALEDSGM